MKATTLEQIGWPASRVGEAVRALAVQSRLVKSSDSSLQSPFVSGGTAPQSLSTEARIEAVAERIGLEAEPFAVLYGEIEEAFKLAAPCIVRLSAEETALFLAVVRSNRRRVHVLSPDGTVHRVSSAFLRDLVRRQFETALPIDLSWIPDAAGIPERRERAVIAALAGEQLRSLEASGFWLLRPAPEARFGRHARQAHLDMRLAALIVLHAIQYCLLLGSWWLIGRGALQGRLEHGWILAWVLLLMTMIPFRLAATWLEGIIAIRAGGLLKQRLLFGALRLDPEEIRRDGSGQLLGRVVESAAVESLAVSGGFLGLVAIIELVLAAVILSAGAGASLHFVLFACWSGIAFLLAWRYYRQRKQWTESRVSMTNDLVERMVGYRTRLAQQSPDHWHNGEDEALANYIDSSMAMDRSTVLLLGLVPRGWVVIALAVLGGRLITADIPVPLMAVSVGGVLLGYQALGRFTGSLSQLVGAVIAWHQIGPIFKAAGRPDVKGSLIATVDLNGAPDSIRDQKLVDARDITFKYPDRDEPVLKQANLEVRMGDRVLLEGRSGGGKSTFASLLAGIRFPNSGLLLVNGLDYATLGSKGWRKLVGSAPQFHENHVLTGTLAFNLLMGRDWPPHPDDLKEAEAICRELGLGDLIDRMPSRLMEVVGETGWRLSHGERSRLYIARALLQGAKFLILDESFAALDPETLQQSARCVLNRASTLLIIAHT